MPPSKDKQIEVETRRTELLRIRRRRPKVPFGDPEILALGYTSEDSARKDFYRMLETRRKALDIEVSAYREEQNEILDQLLETHLPPAVAGDIKSSELCLKLLERQAKLNGWEEALKAELSGPNGGPMRVSGATLAELRNLIRAAGDPDDDDDTLEDLEGTDPDDEADDDGDHT
ncbi:hypothetical protein [Streptomyces sp. NBRC 110035]|uniref:hypothetical protein n=1 Tax=Streptomyces sp. NBRC 110035 TaxID=1547867 RepID=UPI0005A984EF|nr:hypothetical protein [Streptomyces sp. NBRC 110035]